VVVECPICWSALSEHAGKLKLKVAELGELLEAGA